MSDQKQQPVMVNEETRPCGCVTTKYSDNTATTAPCLGCGLHFTAQHLADSARQIMAASQALAATAERLRAMQNQAILRAIKT